MTDSAGAFWNLVADIGGTNARFAVADYTSGELVHVERYPVSEHPAFTTALHQFLAEVASQDAWRPLPSSACLALACAVESDVVRFTNSPWSIDRAAISRLLGDISVHLINDFAAVGHAVADLKPGDWHQIGGGAPQPGRPLVVLGPGTGLGVCSLVPSGAGYRVVEGEGGHVSFAPIDSQEIAVLEVLSSRFGRVAVERLLSGAGIVNIYQALAQLAGNSPTHTTPAQVTAAALAGVDTLAERSLQMFCRVLGSTAGDLALTLGAKGGVYIAGGIVPRFIPFAEDSELRHRFEAKGRFRSYLTPIPLRVVIKDDLGLVGAIKYLSLSAL